MLTFRDLGFIRAASGLWTPARISTLLWLDSSDGSTISTVNNAVSQWNDKSGNANHAVQSNASLRPVLTANSQNANSVVEFNPASNAAQALDFSRLTGIGHIFVVAKKNDLNDSSILLADKSADDLRGVNLGEGTGSNFYVQQISPSILNTGATRNVWHIGEIMADGTTAALGIDGTRVTGANSVTMSSSVIGYYRNINAPFIYRYSFRGLVGEIIMTTVAQTTASRQTIEGYLAWKWGLTANLPANHPYKTTPP